MIVKMEYLKNIQGIKTKYKGQEKNRYIRFIVDEYSIKEVLKETRDNRWVVALDYEGVFSFLDEIEYIEGNKPLIVTIELEEVTEKTIQDVVKSLPQWVRVVIKTPEDFNDMRFIYNISQKYINVHFCGGKFLRLQGCNVGCVVRNDIPRKVAESKIEYNTQGCSCIMKTYNIEDLEEVEYLYKEDKEMLKNINTENQRGKKVIESLRDLL